MLVFKCSTAKPTAIQYWFSALFWSRSTICRCSFYLFVWFLVFFYFCRLVTLCSSLCLTKSPSLRCSFYTRSVTDLCQLTYIDRWLKRRHTEPLFPQLCILIRKSSNDSIILVLKTLCPKLLLTVIFIYLFFTLMPQIFLGMIHCCLVAKIFDSYEKHWDRCPVEMHTLWDILRGTCSVYFAV